MKRVIRLKNYHLIDDIWLTSDMGEKPDGTVVVEMWTKSGNFEKYLQSILTLAQITGISFDKIKKAVNFSCLEEYWHLYLGWFWARREDVIL